MRYRNDLLIVQIPMADSTSRVDMFGAKVKMPDHWQVVGVKLWCSWCQVWHSSG